MAKISVAKDKQELEAAITELVREFENKHKASFRVVRVASRRTEEQIEVFTEVELKS